MSNDPVRSGFQPESVITDPDESIYEFEETELEGACFREKIWIDDLDTAKKIRDYQESVNPSEEFTELGPKIREKAVEYEGFDPFKVTEYTISIFGSYEEALGVGVEYHIGHNFETEAAAMSENASSTEV